MAFKRFDQTGNEKLNFKEFSDMMTRRTDSKKTTRTKKQEHSETGTSSNGGDQPDAASNVDPD